jgi:hypothetical protein
MKHLDTQEDILGYNFYEENVCDEAEAQFTDTERLDWIIENNAMLAQKPNGKWVCEIIRVNGYRSIGDFATAREAIDAFIEEK